MKKLWIAIVKLLGWKFDLPAEGTRPEVRHCVFAVAPHTSSADFMIGAAYLWSLGEGGHIFIKKEFFRWPLGHLLRHLGAIPIDRGNRKNDMVATAVSMFQNDEHFSLAITPESTRKPVKRWKRGFWEIAHRAQVPIIPAYIDFANKHIWLGPTIITSDDAEADIAKVRTGFKKEMAKHPNQFIELKG